MAHALKDYLSQWQLSTHCGRSAAPQYSHVSLSAAGSALELILKQDYRRGSSHQRSSQRQEGTMSESGAPTFRRFALRGFIAVAALLAPPAAQSRKVSIPFNPAHFSNSLIINNPLFPLVVGWTYVYRADVEGGCEENRVTVTSNTKHVAAGVTAREVHDVVYSGATCGPGMLLTEDTLDWFAQDDSGNVWYLGEDTKECDASGCVQDPGSWEAGADIDNIGSIGIPGLFMLAAPRNGDGYQQEFYADHAEDVATVTGVNVDATLTRPDAYPPKVFHHCVRTKERSLIEPGSVAVKYYCPTIGMVLEQELSRNGSRSELVDLQKP
jgi:hypothetical protein